MTLTLGQQLKIRSMVFMAGEVIPFFWPMRNFIHHNPLHGLEHLPFRTAVEEGARLFHARGYLPRKEYQRYLAQGKVDRNILRAEIARFLADRPPIAGLDQQHLLWTLLTEFKLPPLSSLTVAQSMDIVTVLQQRPLSNLSQNEERQLNERWRTRLTAELTEESTASKAVDQLFGTDITNTLDDLLIHGCTDFFDEGQSIWHMPRRDLGFFRAWSEIAKRNLRLFLRGLNVTQILGQADTPEGIIAYVMNTLGIPEERWMDYFALELSRLRGWAGFIRWRANTKDYHWNQSYPADLVDFLAIRLVLGLALLQESARRCGSPLTQEAIRNFIADRPEEAYLRYELHTRRVLPAFAQRLEMALESKSATRIASLFIDYLNQKRRHEATTQAERLRTLASQAGLLEQLQALDAEHLANMVDMLAAFDAAEGYCWLRAMEAAYMRPMLDKLRMTIPPVSQKRPFVQALFCIDVRSERLRRHLETLGDYETFGIAGFFGVPLSFIELGKGHERYLCPVLIKPKNVVLEMAFEPDQENETFLDTVKEVLHELKNSVLSPYITVEAVGLLFGIDMVGKTVAPLAYNTWRRKLGKHKPPTSLLVDNLTRAQADSIIRTLQRAMIVRAIGQQLKIEREEVSDEMIKELRNRALELSTEPTQFAQRFGLDATAEESFINTLRNVYRIERHYAQLQLERLARIGFGLDKQVYFVSRALLSIGLTKNFSKIVLLVGHGSSSENNPYESALDCGACGGDQGLVNARVFATLANKETVREQLRAEGIDIPSDTWFVPALHNTTNDTIELQDLDRLPATHLTYLPRMRNGFDAACRLTAAERVKDLGHSHVQHLETAHRIAKRNAVDWTQVRPEWGLSQNAAFIIGSRSLTRALDLGGRTFLHSYDYRLDPKGRLLETILSGPLVVAQWINMEHYFSTIDNEVYGGGSKVYHNVVGRFAVMTGNLGDLRTGLPAQTVLNGEHPYHEPLRLITLIEAPHAFALRAINNIVKIKTLLRNGWIRMVVVDRDEATLYVLDEDDWQKHPITVSPAATTEDVSA